MIKTFTLAQLYRARLEEELLKNGYIAKNESPLTPEEAVQNRYHDPMDVIFNNVRLMRLNTIDPFRLHYVLSIFSDTLEGIVKMYVHNAHEVTMEIQSAARLADPEQKYDDAIIGSLLKISVHELDIHFFDYFDLSRSIYYSDEKLNTALKNLLSTIGNRVDEHLSPI